MTSFTSSNGSSGLKLRAIDKTSFRVFQTNDGRTLIEHPQRITKNGVDPTEMLVVSNSGVVLQDKSKAFPTSMNVIISSHEVMGILGLIDLSFGKYLLVIQGRALVGTIQSHKIWRITKGSAIPAAATRFPAKLTQLDGASLAKYAIDQELLEQLNEIINSGHLYYSTSYDLTHSLQHNYLATNGKSTSTIVDDRYFFNSFLQSAFLKEAKTNANINPWIVKAISGFAGAIDMDYVVPADGLKEEKTRTYTVVLVSRLNHRRLGTRYVRRGLDEDGNAANNVEMEQIVFNHDFLKDSGISSFVQLRGSAPAIWGQVLDLSYRPRLVLANNDKPSVWTAVQKHLSDLKNQYIGEKSVNGGADHGTVVCVNLLDEAGFEGPLSSAYEKAIERFHDTKVAYESFSVNKWCKKMNYKNMDILLDRMRLRLMNSSFLTADGHVPNFSSSGSLRVTKIQTGVARVSCLDSLDRTNLTCSIFAKFILAFQVQSISPDLPAVQVLPATGVSPSEVRDPAAQTRKALERHLPVLTNLWADSGDAISLLYAGTRALKADVTRTGKRQLVKGSVDDGLNSLTRYYLNNFSDGRKQDTYDLWSGKISGKDIQQLVETEGAVKAEQLLRPIFPKDKGLTSLLPSIVVDTIEPAVYQTSRFIKSSKKDSTVARKTKEHLDENGSPQSFIGFAVALMRVYSPVHVTNLFELTIALFLFFYIFIFVKLFGIKGQYVVSKPRFSQELVKLQEIASS